MSYEFTLDTKAPVISNMTVSGEGDARTVSFDVTDSSPVAAIDFSVSPDSVYYFRKLVEDDGEIQAAGPMCLLGTGAPTVPCRRCTLRAIRRLRRARIRRPRLSPIRLPPRRTASG